MTTSVYKNEELLKIGEVAKACNVSVSTIRQWCKKGVLTPVTNQSNHRLFSLKDVLLLKNKTPASNDSDKKDYIAHTKELRAAYLKFTQILTNELRKFTGDVTGIQLDLYGSIYVADDKSITEWLVLKNKDHVVFAARHFDNEVYEFKPNPKYAPTYEVRNILTMNINTLFAPSQEIDRPRMANTIKGSLNDLLECLSKHIAKF